MYVQDAKWILFLCLQLDGKVVFWWLVSSLSKKSYLPNWGFSIVLLEKHWKFYLWIGTFTFDTSALLSNFWSFSYYLAISSSFDCNLQGSLHFLLWFTYRWWSLKMEYSKARTSDLLINFYHCDLLINQWFPVIYLSVWFSYRWWSLEGWEYLCCKNPSKRVRL